ncbi:hypothetical protein BDN72DRAFT_174105 [Pluteus cervinus]|uniref:Uncharacterized protein n=1 Tax=Pluteus cervinus TaxID=181527 RepID=A0ACD3AKZ3_9AGAR|nr:hypothetical protein BDN72DRAFT_174105 [Pluteus cervinus]
MGAPVFDPNLVAIWCETLVYGFYTPLFFQSLLIARRRSLRRSSSAQVFKYATIVLYTIATLHVSVGLYRIIVGFVYTMPDERMFYWFARRWEHVCYFTVQSIMSYVGQALLIYRCFRMYDSNWLVITPSLILYAVTTGISLFCNYLWSRPDIVLHYTGLLDSLIPLCFAQHLFTPCLTVYRLLRQHHESRASGIQNSRSRLNLRTVSMIILESTMVYSVALLVTIIMQCVDPQNVQIPSSMSVPTLGLCFSLITIRLHGLTSCEYNGQDKSTLFTVDHQFVFDTPDTEDTQNLDSSDSRSEQLRSVDVPTKLRLPSGS